MGKSFAIVLAATSILILLSLILLPAAATAVETNDNGDTAIPQDSSTGDSFRDLDLSHKVILVILLVLLVGTVLVALYRTRGRKSEE